MILILAVHKKHKYKGEHTMRKTRLFIIMALLIIFSVVPVQAAKKKSVHVITKIEYLEYYDDIVNTVRFKHNKNGLVTEKTITEDGAKKPWCKITYKYGKNNLVKSATAVKYGSKVAKTTYKYNSKNQLIKRTSVVPAHKDRTVTRTYKCQ